MNPYPNLLLPLDWHIVAGSGTFTDFYDSIGNIVLVKKHDEEIKQNQIKI